MSVVRLNSAAALQCVVFSLLVALQRTSSFSFAPASFQGFRPLPLRLPRAADTRIPSTARIRMMLDNQRSHQHRRRAQGGRTNDKTTQLDFKVQVASSDGPKTDALAGGGSRELQDRVQPATAETTHRGRTLADEIKERICDTEENFNVAKQIYHEVARRGASMPIDEQGAQLTLAMKLMDQVFEQDFERILSRQYASGSNLRTLANVTCMRPKNGEQQVEARLFDDDLLAMELEEGRVCHDGSCCSACSRVALSDVISASECREMITRSNELMFDTRAAGDADKQNLPIQISAAAGAIDLHLTYIRVVERMRRCLAYEYGLELSAVSPRQTFISCIAPCMAEDTYKTLHVDECSTAAYHYSCVLYLSDSRDFDGGDFVFCDSSADQGARRDGGTEASGSSARRETRFSPERGQAMMFSSGWENYHYVDRLREGVRFAVPIFFSTESTEQLHPVWTEGDDASRAKALFHMGIFPESYDDFLHFKQRWAHFFARAQQC